jgi:hypothetical protein
MPIDRGGLVQSLLYVILAYSFDFHDALHAHTKAAPPAEPQSAEPPPAQ